MVWYRSYYICNRNPTSALTNDRCPLKPRTRRAQDVEDLLQQLAPEPDHIEGQIASIASATLAQDQTRTDLSQLLQQAPRRLAHADVDTRAVILELLDVTVTPTEDGYHIEASIPLDPDDTSEDPGYIASLAPRPAP